MLRDLGWAVVQSKLAERRAIGDIRNDAVFVHDSQIMEEDEAPFIVVTVTSMLRFVRSIRSERFEEAA